MVFFAGQIYKNMMEPYHLLFIKHKKPFEVLKTAFDHLIVVNVILLKNVIPDGFFNWIIMQFPTDIYTAVLAFVGWADFILAVGIKSIITTSRLADWRNCATSVAESQESTWIVTENKYGIMVVVISAGKKFLISGMPKLPYKRVLFRIFSFQW